MVCILQLQFYTFVSGIYDNQKSMNFFFFKFSVHSNVYYNRFKLTFKNMQILHNLHHLTLAVPSA